MSQSLNIVLARDIEERVQLKLPLEAIRSENLPLHLRMNFRVIDEHGRMLAQSRDLAELRSRLAVQAQERFAAAEVKVPTAENGGRPRGITNWSFGELPELLEVVVGGRSVVGFPALVDEGGSVSVGVFDTSEKARMIHRAGLRRLFALELKEQVRHVERALPGLRELALQFMPFGTESELKAQLVSATLDRCCMADPLPSKAEEFHARKEQARPRITLVAQELTRLVSSIVNEHAGLQRKLAATKAFSQGVDDIRTQCARLLTGDFIAATPFERLQHFPRYLKASSLRLEKLRADPARDARLLSEWQQLARPYERERSARENSGVVDPALQEFRWWLEELRVQLFAQELKTPVPVSVKRLQKIWDSRAHGAAVTVR
jgi:ATP-dependent helicase HrpA